MDWDSVGALPQKNKLNGIAVTMGLRKCSAGSRFATAVYELVNKGTNLQS